MQQFFLTLHVSLYTHSVSDCLCKQISFWVNFNKRLSVLFLILLLFCYVRFLMTKMLDQITVVWWSFSTSHMCVWDFCIWVIHKPCLWFCDARVWCVQQGMNVHVLGVCVVRWGSAFLLVTLWQEKLLLSAHWQQDRWGTVLLYLTRLQWNVNEYVFVKWNIYCF